jgi:hypothetical protein
MIGSLVSDRVGTAVAGGSRAAATPADGFRIFVEAHLDETYRLATFLLGHRAEAEDAVHDAAISAWRHWTDRRDPDRTEAWFRRIVINASHDRIRARRRVRAVDVGLDIELAHHGSGTAIRAIRHVELRTGNLARRASGLVRPGSCSRREREPRHRMDLDREAQRVGAWLAPRHRAHPAADRGAVERLL